MTEVVTPHARAAQLGVDYAQLQATSRRLRWSMYLVDGIAGVVAGALLAVWVLLGGDPWQLLSPLGLLLGVLVGLCAGFLPAALVAPLLRWPRFAALSVLRQQAIAAAVVAGLGVFLLWVAVRLVPADYLVGVLFAFSIATAGVSLVSQLQFARLFEKGHPNLEFVVRQVQALPAAQTVFGGSIRWMVVTYAISLVETLGIGLLVVALPSFVLVILVVRSAVWTVACLLEFARGPLASALAGGAFAVAALATGIAALVLG